MHTKENNMEYIIDYFIFYNYIDKYTEFNNQKKERIKHNSLIIFKNNYDKLKTINEELRNDSLLVFLTLVGNKNEKIIATVANYLLDDEIIAKIFMNKLNPRFSIIIEKLIMEIYNKSLRKEEINIDDILNKIIEKENDSKLKDAKAKYRVRIKIPK